MKRNSLIASLLIVTSLVAASCGRGKPSAGSAPLPTREFPQLRASQMHPDGPLGAAKDVVIRFWDGYFKDIATFRSDSLYPGGVERTRLEEAYGLYATLLWNVPPETARTSTARLYDQLAAARDSVVTAAMVDWTSRYLYDPNSPVRCEDFYRPFVEKLAKGDLAPEEMKMMYDFQARMCALNAMGTPAADFGFTDTRGRKRTLYDIPAEYTLLIFGNPDCHACKELVVDMEADPMVAKLCSSGRLQVVDIFIDREVDSWKAHVADYPADWINGYDHTFQIREDILYNVRALPSMYLLDKDKTVLLKDAPTDILLSALSNIAYSE